ncbi:hypothetical protein [Leucobacter sp. G161]|uniref:hypothetical protein n=1 Tax=Leucobacter sp. G161 TaxID=663704 RepID=UPI000A8233E5|nr:hypothetical protein [Leucobacter sp. G161]
MTHTYLAANQTNWDDRASLHAARDGSGYVVQQFIDDRAERAGVAPLSYSLRATQAA